MRVFDFASFALGGTGEDDPNVPFQEISGARKGSGRLARIVQSALAFFGPGRKTSG